MEEKPKAAVQLAPHDAFIPLEHVSMVFDAAIPVGVKPEELLAPSFWAHHAVKMQPMCEIRARCVDGTWMARLVVLDCSRTWAKVQQLHLYNFTSPDVSRSQSSEQEIRAMLEAHNVIHRGPRKWSVVRNADHVVLAEDLGTREEARDWLNRHVHEVLVLPETAKAVAKEATT